MASKKIELTDAEWTEIYYALSDKADAIKRGSYGPQDKRGQNKEWIGILKGAMAQIADKVKV
jgi:hypothetical protein